VLSSVFLQKKQKKLRKMKIFVLLLFFFTAGCSGIVKNCKISPDLERISESAKENLDNLAETELRSATARCEY